MLCKCVIRSFSRDISVFARSCLEEQAQVRTSDPPLRPTELLSSILVQFFFWLSLLETNWSKNILKLLLQQYRRLDIIVLNVFWELMELTNEMFRTLNYHHCFTPYCHYMDPYRRKMLLKWPVVWFSQFAWHERRHFHLNLTPEFYKRSQPSSSDWKLTWWSVAVVPRGTRWEMERLWGGSAINNHLFFYILKYHFYVSNYSL